MERISVAEYKRSIKNRTKYNAKRTEYKGRMFDSKKEAEYASQLDLATRAKRKADRVVGVEYQVKYHFEVKGTPVFSYYADFRVTYGDGRVEVVDIKGYRGGPAYAMFRLKKKCIEAYYKIKIIEI